MTEVVPKWVEILAKAVQAHGQKNYKEAIILYNQALAINSELAVAYFKRGMCYYWLRNYTLMLPDFQQAIMRDGNNAEMLQTIAQAMIRINDFFIAIQLLQRAIEIKPDFELAWLSLVSAYDRIGNAEGTRRMYSHLVQKFPNNPTFLVQQAYFLPAIPTSKEEIEEMREQFIQNLDRLMQQNFRLESPQTQIQDFPFYHTYHAKNNVKMAKKLSEFFLSCCPSLAYVAPHCAKARMPGQKIRVGFVSEFMHKITLNQFWLLVMKNLALRNDFEVIIFSNSPSTVEYAQQLAGKIHKYVMFKKTLEEVREQIADEEIDVLIYLEIGMAKQSYFLAHARLAPVQCVTHGHPVTTGIKTMDHFISAKFIEIDNAQEHYTENLLLCERLPIIFIRHPQPPKLLSRQDLGLPPTEKNKLYCCPVTLYKIHPDMDLIFASILRQDPQAIIILFDSSYRTLWRATLEKRFATQMSPEFCERIKFLPHADQERFVHFLSNMDAIIDSIHFSMGTTAYICLGANLPFVTLPGEFARGRPGYTLYQYMQMNDLVADSEEKFVSLSIKLANDSEFRDKMTNMVRERSEQVFSDFKSVDFLAEKIIELAKPLTAVTH